MGVSDSVTDNLAKSSLGGTSIRFTWRDYPLGCTALNYRSPFRFTSNEASGKFFENILLIGNSFPPLFPTETVFPLFSFNLNSKWPSLFPVIELSWAFLFFGRIDSLFLSQVQNNLFSYRLPFDYFFMIIWSNFLLKYFIPQFRGKWIFTDQWAQC